MDKGGIKEVYQIDVNGSPTKMVVLSAKNNNVLAQLFKATATILAKTPQKGQGSNQKENNLQSSRKKSKCSCKKQKSVDENVIPSARNEGNVSSSNLQIKMVKAIDISPQKQMVKKQANIMNLIEEKHKENSIAYRYIQKAIQREAEKSQNSRQSNERSFREVSINQGHRQLYKSAERLKQIKQTNE